MEGFAAVVGPDVWTRLARLGTAEVYHPGETLLRQGETADRVLLLTGGRVKVSLVDSAGNAILLAIRGPGQVLGEIALLDGASRSATVTAIDTCEARSVAIDPFVRHIRSLGLEADLIRFAVRRVRESEEVRLELATLSAGERVIRALMRLAVPSAPPDAAEGAADRALDIGLDQTELGQAIGLSRASISGKLAELRAEGVISTYRGRIVINDLTRLRKLASE
ncbi:Crp/Fnr family transcriptional regulator [Sphaerisporangium sp. NBC_01403]|uniref:Crp/Fnr family transcriptional regulator n=1 Tax=Sphaerisporangium sp. NBC_01403 TaxID=2903599 RepID=UPI0032487827